MGKKTKASIPSFSEAILGKKPEWNKNDEFLMESYGLSCCPGFQSECLPTNVNELEFTVIANGDVFRTDTGKTATVVNTSAEQRAILFCIKKGKRNTYMAVSIDFVISNYEMVRSHNSVNNF